MHMSIQLFLTMRMHAIWFVLLHNILFKNVWKYEIYIHAILIRQ